MAVHAGNAVNELLDVMAPIADILSSIRFGPQPGDFGVIETAGEITENIEVVVQDIHIHQDGV
jgi:hypothetical protein